MKAMTLLALIALSGFAFASASDYIPSVSGFEYSTEPMTSADSVSGCDITDGVAIDGGDLALGVGVMGMIYRCDNPENYASPIISEAESRMSETVSELSTSGIPSEYMPTISSGTETISGRSVEVHEMTVPAITQQPPSGVYYFESGDYGIVIMCMGGANEQGEVDSDAQYTWCRNLISAFVQKANSIDGYSSEETEPGSTVIIPGVSSSSEGCCGSALILLLLPVAALILRR